MQKQKRILICPLDWGLGHATRCIPIIRLLLKKNVEVIVAADAGPLALLKQEFPQLKFIPLKGYNIQYPRSGSMKIKMLLSIPKIVCGIKTEHELLEKIIEENKIDIVISDNRYGCWNNKVKSIFITHQLMIKVPVGENILHKKVLKYIDNYDECWVPDFEGSINLSGDLAHKYEVPKNTFFVGALSRFMSLPLLDSARSDKQIDSARSDKQIDSARSDKHIDSALSDKQTDSARSDKQIDSARSDKQIDSALNDKQTDSALSDKQIDSARSDKQIDSARSDKQIDSALSDKQTDSARSDNTKYDLMTIISGPEPQRSLFEKLVLEQLKKTDLKALVISGKAEEKQKIETIKNIKIVSHLRSDEMQNAIQNSDIVLCRSGYSSIMDLACLGKKAIFIPTPGQTEQEYLAKIFMQKGISFSQTQNTFDLQKALEESKKYKGFEKIKSNTDLEKRIDLL